MSNHLLQLGERCGRVAAAALLGLSCFATACTARVDTMHPVAADEVYVDAPPAYVATAPTAVYQGQTVYYVDGRWYRPNNGRWSYYRNPPPELQRHRGYVQAAPPARPAYRGYDGYGGGPRPAYPGRAPDAVRVQ